MLTESQITELNEWITDTFGTPAVLAEYLDLAVEMLFYVETGTFEQQELQDVVTVLRDLKRLLVCH
jgi:hypothetical protein